MDDEGRRVSGCYWAGRQMGSPVLVGLGPASWCLPRKTELLNDICNINGSK